MAADAQQQQGYTGPFGERYLKVFFCHGCQTCYELIDDGTPDGKVIQRQHILSCEDVTESVKKDKEASHYMNGD